MSDVFKASDIGVRHVLDKQVTYTFSLAGI